jgi:hypothetical protein
VHNLRLRTRRIAVDSDVLEQGETKVKLTLLPLILLLHPLVYANQLTDAITKDVADLTANTVTLQTASSAGKEASQHYDHILKDMKPLFVSEKTHYEDDVSEYNRENTQVKVDMDRHNANRCMQDSCTTAYNSERDALNVRAVEMQSRESLLDKRRGDLNTMYQNLYTDTQETLQKIRKARPAYDVALSERKAIIADLNKLKAQSVSCRKLLKAQGQGTAEALKNKCGGVQFDDTDANLPPPPPDLPAGLNTTP